MENTNLNLSPVMRKLTSQEYEGYEEYRSFLDQHGYYVNTINQFCHPLMLKRLFKEGDYVVCINDNRPYLDAPLKKGEIYTVARLAVNHGMACVYLEGIGGRHMESRFKPLV